MGPLSAGERGGRGYVPIRNEDGGGWVALSSMGPMPLVNVLRPNAY